MPHIIPAGLSNLLMPGIPIYALSPHLDDVVWSAGGLLQALAADGFELTLVNVFSQCIFVNGEMRPPAEASAIRKGEDHQAAQAAGFRNVISLDFPEIVLRDTPITDIFDPAYQAPAYFMELLAGCLKQTIPERAVLLAPAGYGGHKDHVTVRRAVLTLPQPKVLYTDLPYGTRGHNDEGALTFLQNSWQDVRVTLQPQTVEEHLKLFWYYRSQASPEVAEEISAYLTRQGLHLWAAK